MWNFKVAFRLFLRPICWPLISYFSHIWDKWYFQRIHLISTSYITCTMQKILHLFNLFCTDIPVSSRETKEEHRCEINNYRNLEISGTRIYQVPRKSLVTESFCSKVTNRVNWNWAHLGWFKTLKLTKSFVAHIEISTCSLGLKICNSR